MKSARTFQKEPQTPKVSMLMSADVYLACLFGILNLFIYYFNDCNLNSLLTPVEQTLLKIFKLGKNNQTSSYPYKNFHALTKQMGPPPKDLTTRTPIKWYLTNL